MELLNKVVRTSFVVTLTLSAATFTACNDGASRNGADDVAATRSAVTAAPPLPASAVHERGKAGARGVALKRLNRVQGGVPGRYIVVLDDAPGLRAVDPQNAATRLHGRFAFTHKHLFRQAFRGFSVAMNEADAAALAQDPEVAYVVEDGQKHVNATETNPPWGLDRIDQRGPTLDNSYTTTPSGAGVHAYVLDTGILPTHSEFAGRAGVDNDTVGDGRNGIDCNGHGTHVAGTIGGTKFGVAKSARLHAIRVLDCNGNGFDSDIMAGLEWVIANHASPAIVNMSLGGPAFQEFDDVVRAVVSAGVTVVVSAGNASTFADDESPARVLEAITVGASDGVDARAEFSNFGRAVDVFAPGVDVTSSWFATTVATQILSGTSMASPHVAGVAALYLETHPTAAPAAVEAAIVSSSTRGAIKDPGSGAPNRLLFSGLTTPSPRAALFVVGNTTLSIDDAALNTRLVSLGYTVTIKSASALVSGDATGKAVAIISSTVDSAQVGSKLTNVATPVVNLENRLYDDLKMTGPTLGTDFGIVSTATPLQVHDELSALSAGLRGTFNGSTFDDIVQPSTAGGRNWGVPAATAVGLDGTPLLLSGSTTRAAVFGYEAGAAMVGLTAPARRVAFFADSDAVRTFTAEGFALFDAAVEWAAGPVMDVPTIFSFAPTTIAPGNVTLTWFTQNQNQRHEIRRATKAGGPYDVVTTIATAGTPVPPDFVYTFTDNSVVTGQTYFYVVTPIDAAGRRGRPSAEVRAALVVPGLPTVINFYEIDQNGNLLATDVSMNFTGWTLMRVLRGDSSAGPFTQIGTQVGPGTSGFGATFFQDTTTVANHVYYYVLQPSNGFGDGPTTAPVQALYTSDAPRDPVLTGLVVTSLPGGIRAQWEPTPNLSDYNVIVTRLSDGVRIFQGDVTQPDITLFVPPDTYEFFVVPGGTFLGSSTPATATVSPFTGTVLLVVGKTPLRAGDQALSDKLTALGYAVTIRLSHDVASGDADGFTLAVVSSTAVASEVGSELNSTPTPVLVMQPFVLGNMQMTGLAGTNFGVLGNQDTFIVDIQHPLGVDAPRTARLTTRLGNFGWGVPVSSAVSVAHLPEATPTSGLTKRSLFAYPQGVNLAGGSAAPGRRVALLIDADSMVALTADGNSLLAASVRWLTNPDTNDPETPTGVTATRSGSSVVVSWTASARATRYVVMRGSVATLPNAAEVGRQPLVRNLATNVTGTTFTDTSPLSGAPYLYYVQALDDTGGSDRSAGAWGGVNIPPGPPTISTVALNASARINMAAVGPTTSLRVLRASQSGGPYTTVVSNLAPTTTSFTVTGLTNGTPVFFVVEGVSSLGVTRSLEAYAIPVPTVATPTGLTAVATNGQVALSWNAVANARGYSVKRGASGASTPTDVVVASTTVTSAVDVNVPNGVAFKYFVTTLGDDAITSAAATVTATPRGTALYVRASTASAGDTVLINRIAALGYTVVQKVDSALVTADATGKDVLVISETVTSGNLDGKLTNVTTPILSMEPALYDDLKMSAAAGPTTAGQTQVAIVDPSHPMAAGLSGIRTANTTPGTYGWTSPGGDVRVVATMLQSSTRASIFAYQSGSTMVGLVAPARRVGLFVDSLTAASFTADGQALFDAAVRWTAGVR